MKPAFEIIPHVLQENEPAILKECCWAVARILHQSGRHSAIDSMITPAFCSRLIEIFRFVIILYFNLFVQMGRVANYTSYFARVD